MDLLRIAILPRHQQDIMKTLLSSTGIALLLLFGYASTCPAEILVENVDVEKAKKLGIAMKSKVGKNSVKVWLEFKKEGALEKFTYAELRMDDAKGNYLASAMLKPHPVVHGQPGDLVTVAFTTTQEHLARCSFMVVAYPVPMGGEGYILKVADFIEVGK